MGLHTGVPAHGPSKGWSPGAELGQWTGGHCVGLPGEAGKAIKATGVLRALRARALLIHLRIEGLFVFMKKH